MEEDEDRMIDKMFEEYPVLQERVKELEAHIKELEKENLLLRTRTVSDITECFNSATLKIKRANG